MCIERASRTHCELRCDCRSSTSGLIWVADDDCVRTCGWNRESGCCDRVPGEGSVRPCRTLKRGARIADLILSIEDEPRPIDDELAEHVSGAWIAAVVKNSRYVRDGRCRIRDGKAIILIA